MSKESTPSMNPEALAHLKEVLDQMDTGEDPSVFLNWIHQQYQRMGVQGYQSWILNQWNEDLDWDLRRRFMYAMCRVLPPEFSKMVGKKSIELLTQKLIEAGLQPGLDFSVDEGGMMLSEKAEETMYRVIPPEGRKGIEQYITVKRNCPWEKLEERLGVPFRANLLLRLDALAEAEYPPEAIAGWILSLWQPIAYQVLGDSDRVDVLRMLSHRLRSQFPRVEEQVREVVFERIEEAWIKPELADVGIIPLLDVAIAAGASPDNGEILAGGQMTRAALERLALVWRGDRLSVPELIAELDRRAGGAC